MRTGAQDLTNQVEQLKAAGCATIFREKISGATADRPQLKKLMAKLAAGDVVVIPAVDRLSRDTTDLLVIARDMQRAGRDCAPSPNRWSIPRPTSPNWCSPCLGLPPSWSVAASSSAQRAVAPTPRPRAFSLAASPYSRRISNGKRASGSRRARHSAASHVATTSVRRRFRGCHRYTRSTTENCESAPRWDPSRNWRNALKQLQKSVMRCGSIGADRDPTLNEISGDKSVRRRGSGDWGHIGADSQLDRLRSGILLPGLENSRRERQPSVAYDISPVSSFLARPRRVSWISGSSGSLG